MTDALHVRTGTPDDVDAMMALAEMATDENALTAPSRKKLLEDIWSALNLHYGIVGIIGNPGAQIEAAVLLRIAPMWYSEDDDLSLIERAVFVHPEFRAAKGGRGARLLEFANTSSIKLGLPLVIGILSSDRTEAKVRMYKRILGEPSGAYWILNGRTGTDKVIAS